MRMPAQGEEGGFTGVADEDDIAASPPIASIRPALGNEFLTTKAEAARSAFPGADEDCGTIDKHGLRRF